MKRELIDAEIKVLTELSFKKSIKKGNKMSKKLTAKQALNNLYYILCHYSNKCGVGGAYTKEDGMLFDALELKKLIEKSLKALEIIKEKEVDISTLLEAFNPSKMTLKAILDFNGLDFYNVNYYQYDNKARNLTQEEFDLLKEVLL